MASSKILIKNNGFKTMFFYGYIFPHKNNGFETHFFHRFFEFCQGVKIRGADSEKLEGSHTPTSRLNEKISRRAQGYQRKTGLHKGSIGAPYGSIRLHKGLIRPLRG